MQLMLWVATVVKIFAKILLPWIQNMIIYAEDGGVLQSREICKENESYTVECKR